MEPVPCSAILLDLLPLVLMHSHMKSAELVALFRTCHATTKPILQHVKQTVLSLDFTRRTKAARTGRRDAMALAAQSRNVRLVLIGDLTIPSRGLAPRITSLVLQNQTIYERQLRNFDKQLPDLPRLQELGLSSCKLADDVGWFGRCDAFNRVHRLEIMNCTAQALQRALGLVNAEQLTHLKADASYAYSVLPQLPRLQRLHITGNYYYYSGSSVDDGLLTRLMSVPEVEVPGQTCLRNDHSDTPCQLRVLNVRGKHSLHALAALPLANIQRFYVYGSVDVYALNLDHIIYGQSVFERAVANLAQCTELVCVPVSSYSKALEFELSLTRRAQYAELVAQLITLCTKRLEGALRLRYCDWGQAPVRAALAGLPPTIPMVCFEDDTCGILPEDPRDLLTHLPTTVVEIRVNGLVFKRQ